MIYFVYLKWFKMKLVDWQISDFYNLRYGYGYGKYVWIWKGY